MTGKVGLKGFRKDFETDFDAVALGSFGQWEDEFDGEPVLVGDWATVTIQRNALRRGIVIAENRVYRKAIPTLSEHLLRGYVELTPARAAQHPVELKGSNGKLMGLKNRFRAYHLSQVVLLELDGQACYERQPDLIIDPVSQSFTIEPVFEVPDDTLIPCLPTQRSVF